MAAPLSAALSGSMAHRDGQTALISVWSSPVGLSVDGNDIISQDIQGAANLHLAWLTADKHKRRVWRSSEARPRWRLDFATEIRRRWFSADEKIILCVEKTAEKKTNKQSSVYIPDDTTEKILAPASRAGRNRFCWGLEAAGRRRK